MSLSSQDMSADSYLNQLFDIGDNSISNSSIIGKLCDIDNTERLKRILVNKIIKNARKYHYFTVEDRPRFSELLDMLPCMKEELIGNAINAEIDSNKHLKKRLQEIAAKLEVVDINKETFSDAEREAVKEIYFAMGSDARRSMFRIAKHYNLYENIMSEPVLYVRELLDMEKLEILDAVQGDKVELTTGGKMAFNTFYDNIFGKVYLYNDGDYYNLSDVKAIYKENKIVDESGRECIVGHKTIFDEKRSIKEFSNNVYVEALRQLCRQINGLKLNNQSSETLEENSSNIKIYSFKRLKDKIWLNKPRFQVGQLIFIFGHFGIVESIVAGVPTVYLSSGECLELDYAAYGEFSVAMVEIQNADSENYKLMRDKIISLHEQQEEERVRNTYRHR